MILPLLPNQIGAEKVDASREIIKYSIAARIIDTQSAAEELYYALNFEDNSFPKIKAYRNFISTFKGLFISVKHNISHSRKVPDWGNKEITYEDFFESPKNPTIDKIKESLKLFDDFLDDLVTSGIYSILKEVKIIDVEGESDETAVNIED